MKLPKPRKLPSGNWFIQLRLDGESIPVTAPTAKQCTADARLIKSEYLAGKRKKSIGDITLRQAVDKYIASRDNILSPSTIRSYHAMRDNRFTNDMDKSIMDIKDWQAVCNDEITKCSPKTLKSAWHFIASALKFSGITVPRVTLPQVVVKERPFLEPEQILEFIKAVKGQSCEIPALLALHSLRRSEICALTWDNIDLENRRILVSGAAVYDKDHKLVQKAENKNRSSNRYVPIMMDELHAALSTVKDKTGLVYRSNPNLIWRRINTVCRERDLPEIGVHGLRHSFASLAYHLSVPEKIAMQIGGWADYGTMRKIYTHLAQKDIVKYEAEITKFFNKNANENANIGKKA